ncbi:hypothetical protein GK107_14310 [Geobacillus thermoleovorans]|nr:hypothetical protein GK107_14310 [Geobacillus thermoleovorans]
MLEIVLIVLFLIGLFVFVVYYFLFATKDLKRVTQQNEEIMKLLNEIKNHIQTKSSDYAKGSSHPA